MSCLIGITADGVPLFVRSYHGMPQPPFPAIGSLSGVHMYGLNNGFVLKGVSVEHGCVGWKLFHQKVLLIVAFDREQKPEAMLQFLLDQVFDAIVLTIGVNEILLCKTTERLKRSLRSAYRLVDALFSHDPRSVGPMTGACECLPELRDAAVLQEYLGAFLCAAESNYGAVAVRGLLAVASEGWWSLSHSERMTISLLVRTLGPCSAQDIPIYLPQASPTVPHRLLTLRLARDVEVWMLCGPKPLLHEVEHDLLATHLNASISVALNYGAATPAPFNVPQPGRIDDGVLGYLLVNRVVGKSLGGVRLVADPQGEGANEPFATADDVWRALRAFSERCMVVVFGCPFRDATSGASSGAEAAGSVGSGEGVAAPATATRGQAERSLAAGHAALSDPHANGFPANGHIPLETYAVNKGYKTFGLQKGNYELYALFSNRVPVFALRGLAHDTLTQLASSDVSSF